MDRVPVEEYLSTSYEPDREYVDGQLVERYVGEYTHGRLQGLISSILGARERERRFRTFISLRIRVSDSHRFRIPDVCVKALPFHITPILTRPDLVVEVLSPDDEAIETLTKMGDYLAAGIPHIWVVDPYKRTLVEADQSGLRRVDILRLSTPLVGEVDFAALFEHLDAPTE